MSEYLPFSYVHQLPHELTGDLFGRLLNEERDTDNLLWGAGAWLTEKDIGV